LAAGRQLRIPVVAFYHSDFPRALDRTIVRFSGQLIAHGLSAPIRRYIHGLYNQMDATIVASRRLAATLRKGGIRNIEHIALGTDTAQFRPRSSRERVRAEFGVAPKAQLLLFVGRLAREKGIKQLIAAIDMLPADLPVHLALVVDGELDSWVHLEANRRPNLTWLPYCESSDRLADIYSAADLFVHAGRWETFGIVSLEAQACGTPVVAVRGGGLEESLSCESPPSLAAEGTPVALANAIELRLRRHTESPAQRIARHHAICERFSIDRTFSRIFELYERLIGGNRHKQRIASATPQQVGPAGVR
jgi:alpha-1,6-mannosyltransferase